MEVLKTISNSSVLLLTTTAQTTHSQKETRQKIINFLFLFSSVSAFPFLKLNTFRSRLRMLKCVRSRIKVRLICSSTAIRSSTASTRCGCSVPPTDMYHTSKYSGVFHLHVYTSKQQESATPLPFDLANFLVNRCTRIATININTAFLCQAQRPHGTSTKQVSG